MLSPAHIEAIKILQEIDPDICIGGSVCLKAYELLDREIGDLDVFLDKDKPFNIRAYKRQDQYDKTYDFTTDFNGDTLERIPLLIKGVKVCIFLVPQYLLSAVPMDINGLKMNIQNPCFAITGKVLFSKHDAKHIEDLVLIQRRLFNLTLI